MEKHIHPGKIVSSFAVGSRDLYDFMDNNSAIVMLDVSFVNVGFAFSSSRLIMEN
jgi:acyl-CoA hydrolase